MSALVYRICVLLSLVLARVPVGTNLGLLHLLMALLCGRFLAARGAVFPALASLGLSDAQVRRSEAALCYGRWHTSDLLASWQQAVTQEGRFLPCDYEGIRPVACDLTAFFRPQLRGRDGRPLDSKHYVSEAGKALPAVVLGLCAAVGQIKTEQIKTEQSKTEQIKTEQSKTEQSKTEQSKTEQSKTEQSKTEQSKTEQSGDGCMRSTRLGLPRLVLRRETGETEAALQKRLIAQAGKTLAPAEALIVDAGFSLPALLDASLPHEDRLPFVARARSNQTARRSVLPAYKGRGPHPKRGDLVRPLARTWAGRTIEATVPDATASWQDGKHRLHAQIWDSLVLPDVKLDVNPDAPVFRLVAIHDPRYSQPLLLASNLAVSAHALWRLYRDRWAIEQMPLSAKPMLGAERSFVFGAESRYRLPELALLAGNILSYVAATSAPVASGFWDRASRPTCGRVRRSLLRVNCEELPVLQEQLRKKRSVTAHLTTGVEAHRRHKPEQGLSQAAQTHIFTGN